jgi:superfamily II DNA/RNA helicase
VTDDSPTAPLEGLVEPGLDPGAAVERFLDWAVATGITPYSHQEEALLALASEEHVILATPTGSGKTLVALGMHFLSRCSGRRSYYTAPIKALVSEKFFALVDLFGREAVGMITGDSRINPEAPIICCTAEILANLALREGTGADVGTVVMDEFHYYGDRDRGWAWQVPLLTLPRTQFLLMSATLGDVSGVVAQLDAHTDCETEVIANAPRPVPLGFEYVLTPVPATVELLLRRNAGPVYVVHFSQDAALETAQGLSSLGVSDRAQRDRIKEAISGVPLTTVFGKTLRRLLLTGVGVHHAGMLPRYRRLVEQLAQQGLLPVICGTDTLGVGINVPIHTVLLTALTKYDGVRMRRLRSREFHQIAGRAGRAGFDTEGLVIAEAPEHEIENAKAEAKAAGDPKRLRKLKRKSAPAGFVTWGRPTFEHLIEAPPERLVPQLRITHSMMLAEIAQGGDVLGRVRDLIFGSAQPPAEQYALGRRAIQIYRTLRAAGVVEQRRTADGRVQIVLTVDLPDDFALDQPLSPFLLAALELLDPESPTYTLDVISMVEATLDDPRQVLRAQERQAKTEAMAAMRAEGLEYEERQERLAEITYPRPLEELLTTAFEQYRAEVPWAHDYELHPKSVVREMVETASGFADYIARYSISRSEGTLLRYLSDAYRALSRTVPEEHRSEELRDIVSWLGVVVRAVDSSLVDEWEGAAASAEAPAPPKPADQVVADRRGVTVLVRNALFRRVQLMALDRPQALGELDEPWGFGVHSWERVLDDYYGEYDSVGTDADARSTGFFEIDMKEERSRHRWRVRQILKDPAGDRDWAITAEVDLDATQERGEAVFDRYRVGRQTEGE